MRANVPLLVVCRVPVNRARLAIDFGTSHTVAVVRRDDQQPRALLFDGSPLLPSCVYAGPGGELHTGRDAERLAQVDPSGFDPSPKRNIDHENVLLGRHEYDPAALIGAVLNRVARAAAEAGVGAGEPAVLTCPADWGRRRRAVLLRAAQQAGIRVEALVDEPVAAATYCLDILRVAPGQSLVVFDFGGGTLDVAAVRREPDGLRVLATGGLDNLGGLDVDAALVGQLGQLIDPALWSRLSNPADAAALRDRRAFWAEVRAAKEMLSRTTSAPVSLPGDAGALHLTRDELERVAGPLVDRAVDEARRVLRGSGVGPDELAGIFLVGGSSRMPLVASKLHARLGVAPAVPEQPELPVAYGALLAVAAPAPPPAERQPDSPDWSTTTMNVGVADRALTSPTASKAKRGAIVAGAAAIVVLLAGGSIYWYASQRPTGTASKGGSTSTSTAAGSGSATSAPAGSGSTTSAPAGFVACAGGRYCAQTPTCWAGMTIVSGNATARKLGCDEPHRWETFAVGYLPGDAVGVPNDDLLKRNDLDSFCAESVLVARSRDPSGMQGWERAVLPVQVGGAWLFHCLARPPEGGDHTGTVFRTGP
jgi:Ethanolamine utilization protein EutJ (predicted chaperonin)